MKSFYNNKKILVTGGAGFLGSHVVDVLINRGVTSENIIIPRSETHDLRLINNCIKITSGIDIAFHVAGNVGGIGYSKNHPATQLFDNASMAINIVEAARINSVEKTTLIGTVCSYPIGIQYPTMEHELWNGYPEETHSGYGISKRLMHSLSKEYRREYRLNSIFLLLANLYGPRDEFKDNISHVIPALIKKMLKRGRKLLQVN